MLLPIMPEEEPLASLLDILLATARQDVAHFRLHLTQVHLKHFITSGFGVEEAFQKYLNIFALSPAFLLRDTLSTTG